MKARIKATGEIVSVRPTYSMKDRNDNTIYYTDGNFGEWTASDLDFLPEKETAVLEGWLCRDNDSLNAQVLIGDKPIRMELGFWENETCDCITLPTDSFPSVTWQSKPKRVRIKIEEIEE